VYTKTILCFANSRKTSGSCIAGKEFANNFVGDWIRPVSNRPTHEIASSERRYADGTYADVLHLIELPLVKKAPSMHQTENQLIAAAPPWVRAGTVSWQQVEASVDAVPGALWLNGHSTQHGNNDKVPEALLPTIADSLKLVAVPGLTIQVALEPGWQGAPGRRRVRGSFAVNAFQYELSVTDPVLSSTYLQRPDGLYPIGPAILCISLAEPMYGYAFKLIAAVFTPQRCAGVT
jgi:hypothetical protein